VKCPTPGHRGPHAGILVLAVLLSLVFEAGGAPSEGKDPLPGEDDGRRLLAQEEEGVVARLVGAADRLVRARSYGLARVCVRTAARMDPARAELLGLEARVDGAVSAFTRGADATDVRDHTVLFDGTALRGLASRGGKVSIDKGELVSASPSAAFLEVSRKPRGGDLDLAVRVADAGSGVGIVVGKGRSGGLVLFLRQEASSLEDLTTGEVLARGRGARRGMLELRILERSARAFLDGEPLLATELAREPEGDCGFLVRSSARITAAGIRSSAAAELVDSCLQLLRRGRGDLALAPAGALVDQGFEVEGGLVRGAALRLLGDEAARGVLGAARSAAARLESLGTRVRRCLEQVDAIELLVLHKETEVLEPFTGLLDRYRVAAEQEIARGRGEIALALAERLSQLAPEDRAARLLSLRAYTVAFGQDGRIPLFEGNLHGWTIKSGVFEVKDGVIHVPSAFEAQVALREDLPSASRILLEVEYRSRSVHELGFVLGGASGTFRVALRRAFHEKGILIRDEQGNERLRREMPERIPPADGQWHRLGVFVDRNRLVVLIDGDPVMSKVFSQPLTGTPGIYVGENTQVELRDVSARLFHDDGEYTSFLQEVGLEAAVVLEAEEVLETGLQEGARGEAFLPHAYNGRILASGFGRSTEHFAQYAFETPEWPEAHLQVRHRGASEDRLLRVIVDGVERAERLRLPASEAAFGRASVSVGRLSRGDHVIRIAPAGEGSEIALDRLIVSGESLPAAEPSREIVSERHPHLRLALSPGVELSEDPGPLLDMVEDVRGYMAEFLGIVLERPLLLNVVSRECWGDPHIGGYATGYELYVPLETVSRDLATVAHELSHCFDHGQGFVPPWMGEGKSVPVFIEFMAERGDRYAWNALEGIDSRARMGRSSRHRLLLPDGRTLLQYWGTELLPYREHPLRGAAYDSSALLCRELQDLCGKTLFREFHALVQRDLRERTYVMPGNPGAPPSREMANALLVDYLSRAAGRDLVPFFQGWGFVIPEICATSRPMEAVKERDEMYVTDAGSSRFLPDVGEGARRELPEGEMVLAFPLPSGCRHVTVEIDVEGEGEIQVEDRPSEAVATEESRQILAEVHGPESLLDGRIRVILRARGGGLRLRGLRATPR